MSNALLLEPLAMASITASNTASGYAASNMGVDMIGVTWRSNTGAATRSVTIDLGSDKALDTIVLLGLYGAQSAWKLAVDLATQAQGAFSGSFWSGSAQDLLAGSAMPESGLGRALWRAPAGAPASARYVRLNFSSLGSAAVEVSRVVIGKAVQMSRNFAFGEARGIRSFGKLDWSERAVPLRRPGPKKRGLGISFRSIYRDEAEATVLPLLERRGNDEPLAIVTDPDANAQRQNRIWYGYLTGDLGAVHRRAGAWQSDLNLVALD